MNDKPYVYHLLRDLVASVIPKGKVVDAGCGKGPFSKAFKDAGYEVIPVDVDPERYGFKVEGLTALKGDITARIPVPDASVDAVVCGEVLEHMESHYGFINECRRIVRPGGVVAFTTPNVLYLKARVARMLVGLPSLNTTPPVVSLKYPGAQHINYIDLYQLRYILHGSKFKVLRWTTSIYSKASILLAPLIPLMWFFTWRCFLKREPGVDVAELKELRRSVFSLPLLFGKKLVVLAERLAD
jgi:2-polyprenyl-3-methyl-5-hydroxy-6-metoxy-1,4-benzoquinol methylase